MNQVNSRGSTIARRTTSVTDSNGGKVAQDAGRRRDPAKLPYNDFVTNEALAIQPGELPGTFAGWLGPTTAMPSRPLGRPPLAIQLLSRFPDSPGYTEGPDLLWLGSVFPLLCRGAKS